MSWHDHRIELSEQQKALKESTPKTPVGVVLDNLFMLSKSALYTTLQNLEVKSNAFEYTFKTMFESILRSPKKNPKSWKLLNEFDTFAALVV
jgi:hypothetical protein